MDIKNGNHCLKMEGVKNHYHYPMVGMVGMFALESEIGASVSLSRIQLADPTSIVF